MKNDDDLTHGESAAAQQAAGTPPKRTLDEVWPVHPTVVWPEGLSLRREDIYTDRIELVGG